MNRLWTPADAMSRVSLWFDAADFDTVAQSSSGQVLSWGNKGCDANLLPDVVTAGSPPTYRRDEKGPGIRFVSGSSQYLRSAQSDYRFAGNVSLTFLAAVRDMANGFDRASIFCFGLGTYPIHLFRSRENSGGPGNGIGYVGGSAGALWGKVEGSLSGSGYMIYEARRKASANTAGDVKLLRSGTLSGVAASTNPGQVVNVVADGVLVGIEPDFLRYFDGFMFELLLTTFDGYDFSRQENFMFQGYLAHKWSMVYLLPPEHPYKSFPPVVCLERPRTVSAVSASGNLWHNY